MRGLFSEDMAVFPLVARRERLAFLSGCLEASEGLGVIVGEKGGTPKLCGPRSRIGEIREFLEDFGESPEFEP